MAFEGSTLLVRGGLTVLSAFAIVGLGAWVVWLNPRHRANRSFGFLALTFGLLRLSLGSTDLLAENDRLFVTLRYSTAALALMSAFAAVHFAMLYPKPRLLGRRRGGALVLVLLAAALLALLLPPFSTHEAGHFEDGYRIGIRSTGMLALVVGISGLMLSLLALLFAVQARRATEPPARDGGLLLFYGFGLVVAFNSTYVWTRDVLRYSAWPTAWERATALMNELALLPLALGLWLVARERPLARAWPLLVASLSALAVALERGERVDPGVWHAALAGVWRLTLPALIGYALVRGQLFDIDVRVKWGIQRGTLAAIFILVFLVVAQLAQNWLSESYGWALGGVVAALMLFAIAPLQRAAEVVANTALPGVHTPRRIGATEDETAYRHAVEMALADGIVTRHEEKALNHLAERLGLPAARAWEIREEVELRGPDEAQRASS